MISMNVGVATIVVLLEREGVVRATDRIGPF